MKVLTGKLFKEMVLCGANTLHNNHTEIDALNVFPVPDGDTGTNIDVYKRQISRWFNSYSCSSGIS